MNHCSHPSIARHNKKGSYQHLLIRPFYLNSCIRSLTNLFQWSFNSIVETLQLLFCFNALIDMLCSEIIEKWQNHSKVCSQPHFYSFWSAISVIFWFRIVAINTFRPAPTRAINCKLVALSKNIYLETTSNYNPLVRLYFLPRFLLSKKWNLRDFQNPVLAIASLKCIVAVNMKNLISMKVILSLETKLTKKHGLCFNTDYVFNIRTE
jgi:hypothetical protein